MSPTSEPPAARALRLTRLARAAVRDAQAVAQGKEAEAEATTDGMPERPADTERTVPAVVTPAAPPAVPDVAVPFGTARTGKTGYGGLNPTQPKEGH